MSSQPSPVGPKGLAARVFGVLTSPRETYAGVAAHPRAFGVLAVVIAVAAAGSLLFFSTKVGQEALLDQQIRAFESFGRTVSDAQYEGMQRGLPFAGYFAAAIQVVAIPLITTVVAGIMYAIFTAGLGGEATFAQVFAIVSHAGVITALQTLFTLPLDYAKGSLASPTTLAVFVPLVDDMTMVGRVLGFFDLFRIWSIVSLAIGLGVLYQRRTNPIALSMLAVYATTGVIYAVVRSAF